MCKVFSVLSYVYLSVCMYTPINGFETGLEWPCHWEVPRFKMFMFSNLQASWGRGNPSTTSAHDAHALWRITLLKSALRSTWVSK